MKIYNFGYLIAFLSFMFAIAASIFVSPYNVVGLACAFGIWMASNEVKKQDQK